MLLKGKEAPGERILTRLFLQTVSKIYIFEKEIVCHFQYIKVSQQER